jgi:superfamily II DNA or RNA helicase
MLTATLPFDLKLILKKDLPEVKRVVYSLSDAIRDSVLPEPSIYKVPIGFDNSRRTEELILTKGGRDKIASIPQTTLEYGKHFDIMKRFAVYNMKVMCTPLEKLNHYNKNIDYLKQRFITTRLDYVKNQWVRMGSVRKKFIAESKTQFTKKLIKSLGDKRMIVFCGSVDQAIELGGDLAVHSKTTAKKNKERIELFQSGKTSILFTNKMLTEGMNLKNIEVVIIVQLDNKNLTFVQKAGRGMRADFPLLFILVVPNSQDEKYFDTSIKGMNQDFIKPYYEFEIDN